MVLKASVTSRKRAKALMVFVVRELVRGSRGEGVNKGGGG